MKSSVLMQELAQYRASAACSANCGKLLPSITLSDLKGAKAGAL